MAEQCINCGQKISDGGLLSTPNYYLGETSVRVVNFVLGFQYEALCEKCGTAPLSEAYDVLRAERDRLLQYIEGATTQFPMMTIGVLPGMADYRVLGMVTANVTVGTGIFNEFSQGLSDVLGRVNSQTGMAHKVNHGEGAARGILATKAIEMGANCIIGVDVDYGSTNNNAATVNMQGTAIKVGDLATVLAPDRVEEAGRIARVWERLQDVYRWLEVDIRDGEVFEPFSLPSN